VTGFGGPPRFTRNIFSADQFRGAPRAAPTRWALPPRKKALRRRPRGGDLAGAVWTAATTGADRFRVEHPGAKIRFRAAGVVGSLSGRTS